MEIDDTTHEKLERLKLLEKKVEAKKTKERERLRRYIDKQLKNGKRQIACLVSGKVYEIMNAIRSKSKLQGQTLSLADIIEKAVLTTYSNNSIDNVAITDGKKNIEVKSNVQATENVDFDTTRSETKKDIPTLTPKALSKLSGSSQPRIEGKHKTLTKSESQNICERLNDEMKIAMDNLTTMFQSEDKPAYKQALIDTRNLLRAIDGKQWTYPNIAKLFNEYQLKTTGKSPLPFDKVKIRDLDQTSKIPHK